MDIEYCYQELQRMFRELKHSKIKTREVVSINQEFQSQISILAQVFDTMQEELKERERRNLAEYLQQRDPPSNLKAPLFNMKIDDSARVVEAELENVTDTHAIEEQETMQHIPGVADVMKKNAGYVAEMDELKLKLKLESKKQQDDENPFMGNSSSKNNAETNSISFKEVDIFSSPKLCKGRWGHLVEGSFRGKRLGVRVIYKESISRFSTDLIFRQIETLASLRHPNILLFMATAMDAPQGMLILTELCHHTLKQVYHEPGTSDMDRLPAMLDVALALNYLHLLRKPIVHNNLSSDCVAVEKITGQPWRAKLSDIGLAVPLMLLSGVDDRSSLYIPPMAMGVDKIAKPSTDVYSYGVLLSEAALNVLPDDARKMTSQLISRMKEKLPAVLCLTQACLSPVPEQRPAMGNLVVNFQNLVANKTKLTAMC